MKPPNDDDDDDNDDDDELDGLPLDGGDDGGDVEKQRGRSKREKRERKKILSTKRFQSHGLTALREAGSFEPSFDPRPPLFSENLTSSMTASEWNKVRGALTLYP